MLLACCLHERCSGGQGCCCYMFVQTMYTTVAKKSRCSTKDHGTQTSKRTEVKTTLDLNLWEKSPEVQNKGNQWASHIELGSKTKNVSYFECWVRYLPHQ